MDKNQRTGLLLLFILLSAWIYFTKPTQEELDQQKAAQDSIVLVQKNELETPVKTVLPDTFSNQQLSAEYGIFAPAGTGNNARYKLSNEVIDIEFSALGGVISDVKLKNYKKIVDDENRKELKKDLHLMNDKENRLEFILPLRGTGNVSTADMYFQASQTKNSITFTATGLDGKSIVQTYTLNPNSYEIDYELSLNGVAAVLDSGTESLRLKYKNHLDKIEKNYTFEKYYSTTYFKESDEDSDYCNCRGDAEETPKKPLDWFSNSNQFFNTTFIAGNRKFENGKFTTTMLDDDSKNLKYLESEVDIPLEKTANEKITFKYYIGPNQFETLIAYENGMEEIIPFGRSLFGSINRWVIRPAFNWLSGFISSKGIVIIVLIFILKMLLYPLMYKMLHSQAKMGALKPELAKLKEKHKDDPQQAQMETMKVYREYGVSPLGGCFPMILQMPIWYALFRFFPASLTFRQESFLWASDLSSYDSIYNLPFEIPAFGAHISLFTILWAISTVAYTYYNSKHMDLSANPAMKYVQYFMPLMFLFFFNNYASGLTCYMFFSNVFNVAQTLGTKKFIFNDEKIRAELMLKREEVKKKPKKKNSFQQRLEEAMKQQQKVQKERDQKRKK